MKTNSITFTSKINIVTTKKFNGFKRGKYIDFADKKKEIVVADEFFTDEIRSCTSGGLVDTKNKVSLGFHLYDDFESNENIHDFLKRLFNFIPNPDRAFILGGKDLKCSPYSLDNYNVILDEISKKAHDVSYFKEHIFPYSESGLHYDLYNDEWTMYSNFRPLTKPRILDVNSIQDLKMAFRNVRIADGDTLFINGLKVDSNFR